MKKWCIYLCAILMICTLQISVNASSNISLKIDTVTCEKGKTVDVPIIVSGNTGIAGAIIDITYDKELTLVGINRGTAFTNLDFTQPNHLTSYPIRLLWDGVDADKTNGTIAKLTFTVPDKTGNFDISATYSKGDIYDENMEDLDVVITNGMITVTDNNANQIEVNQNNGFNVTLKSKDEISGVLIVAWYDNNDRLLKVKSYPAADTMTVPFEDVSSTKYVRFMWWDSLDNLKPFTESKKLSIS